MLLDKHVYYDKTRKMNIVRIHDGEGNLYSFNCAPDVHLKVKEILKHGELITFRLKGDKWKRMDSISDQFHRKYQALIPLEFKDSSMSREEFDAALAERKKKAPIPGEETTYNEAHVSLAVLVGSPDEPMPIPSAPDLSHGKKVGTFRGLDIYRPDRSRPGYALASTPCVKCLTPISGKRPASTDAGGKYTRLQSFAPFEDARYILSEGWTCEKCLSKVNVAIAEGVPAAPPPPVVSGEEIKIVGPTGVNFILKDGTFYYKGCPIISNGLHKWRGKDVETFYVITTMLCDVCGQSIRLKSPVTFKEGKPTIVGSAKCIDADARTIGFKAHKWAHNVCLDGAKDKEEAGAETGEKEAKGEEPIHLIEPEKKSTFNPIHVDVQALNKIKKELPPEPEPEKKPEPEPERRAAPPPESEALQFPPDAGQRTIELTPSGRPPMDLIRRMRKMALDPSINSDVYRGAAHMLFLMMGGDDDENG